MLPNLEFTYYNVYFEIASTIIITLFLIIYLLKNKLQTKLNTVFQQLLICNFFASSLDVATAIIIESKGYFLPWVCYLFNTLYFIASAMLVYLLYKYIAVLVHRTKFISGKGENLAKLPLLIHIVLLVSSPWTKLIYSFDSAGNYIHGPLYLAVYIIPIIYLGLCFYFIIRYHKGISTMQYLVLWLVLGVLITGSIILQAFFMPNLLITYFATAISLIFLYMTIMMNDSYIRLDTNLLNDIAFYTLVSEKYEYDHDFYVCLFKFHDYHKCAKIHGVPTVDQGMKIMQKSMKRAAGGSNLFHLSDDFYAIIINGSTSSVLSRRENKINRLFKRMCEPVRVGALKLEMNPTEVKLMCPNDAANYDAFRQIMDYIVENIDTTVNDTIISVSDDLKNKFDNERNVARALNDAIENDSLQIYLQPLYSIDEKKIVSAEVLCRLIDHELGFVPPDVFIPIAEKMHMIETLGIQVFRKACIFAKEGNIFKNTGLHSIKINLSPIQCNDSGTADELISIAKSYGVSMKNLELELTESTANDGDQAIRDNMEKLKAAGSKLALDDYGTGYSNLVSIIQLPFDYIKIDKSILWSYTKGENTILESVVPMMKKQGYKLVCEGVESEYQSKLLADMGCDFLQGYYYSKPLPKNEFLKYVANFNGNH